MYKLIWGETDLMVRDVESKQKYEFTPVVDVRCLQKEQCKLELIKQQESRDRTNKYNDAILYTLTYRVRVILSNLTILYMIQLHLD